MFSSNTDMFQKERTIHNKTKVPAASLERRKQCFGIPMHIKMKLISINILYYALMVLNNLLLYIYICIIQPLLLIPSWALAIDPFLGVARSACWIS